MGAQCAGKRHRLETEHEKLAAVLGGANTRVNWRADHPKFPGCGTGMRFFWARWVQARSRVQAPERPAPVLCLCALLCRLFLPGILVPWCLSPVPICCLALSSCHLPSASPLLPFSSLYYLSRPLILPSRSLPSLPLPSPPPSSTLLALFPLPLSPSPSLYPRSLHSSCLLPPRHFPLPRCSHVTSFSSLGVVSVPPRARRCLSLANLFLLSKFDFRDKNRLWSQ